MSDVWKCPWCGGEMTEAHPLCAQVITDEADRIEALEAERDAAQARADALAEALEISDGCIMTGAAQFMDMKRQRDALAEKLERAVKGLREIDALDPENMIDGCSDAALRGLVLRMGEAARATFSAIAQIGDKT